MEISIEHDMKMSELVTRHPMLVMMLSRFGITLGFGDKSVDAVCAMHGVDTDFFMLICRAYLGVFPSLEQITATNMDQLVPYLRQSHAYYLSKRLPHIERHLHHIAERLPSRVAKVFMSFFDGYRQEVSAHFDYEEACVFPHIETLRNRLKDSYRIDTYVASHGNIDDKLDDLLQIIFKYLPCTSADDDALDVVYDILSLSTDLKNHASVEDRILVPYVKQLEQTAL